MATLGAKGIKELAQANISKARYAYNKIKNIKGFEPLFSNAVFFNEFVFKTTKNIIDIDKVLLKENILGPLPLNLVNEKYKDCVMFAVTENRTKEEIDKLADILNRV